MQIAIPGVTDNSGIDTNKLIQDLLEAERQPITRIENTIKESEEQIKLWRKIDNNMSLLQDSSKKLYGFNNPFSERLAESSHPSLVTVQSNRGASVGEYSVYIKQTATADRWLSKDINNEYTPPQGNYVFIVGDNEVSFQFSGNTLDSLVDLINTQGNNTLKASTIKQGVSAESQVLLLESLVLGNAGKITLKDKAEEFGKEVRLIGLPEQSNTINISLNSQYITHYIGPENLFSTSPFPPSNDESLSTSSSYLVLHPGAVGQIGLPSSLYDGIPQISSSVITIELYPQIAPKTDSQETQEPFYIDMEDITITGSQEQALEIPNPSSPNNSDTDSTEVQNSSSLSLLFNTLNNTLFSISKETILESIENTTPITISIPLQEVLTTENQESLISFILTNPLIEYNLVVNRILVTDTTPSDMLVPLQPINHAQNAIVEFNGIDIERDTNTITDIIPGTTLTLKHADPDQIVDITITSNTIIIKEDIIAFVGAYNQLMQNLTIYTKNDTTLLDEIQFPTENDRTFAVNNLGVLSTEFGLTRLINSYQQIISNEYNNNVNANISSLRSIGIAPNLADNLNTLRTNKYLDIDEAILDNAIAKFPNAIARLFGSDLNNDVEIDYGIAFRISEITNPYVQLQGIIAQKQTTLKNKISTDNTTKNRYAVRLERYEQELRRKFGTMEQVVNELNDASNTINNLTQQNNNKR